MDIKTALSEFGLLDNEIKVYLALLKTGESTVHDIAKTASIPRTTTYHLLESLSTKGLVGFVIKESKKYFQASEPKKLLETLEEKKKIIKEIMPGLESIKQTLDKKPKVTVYEGIKGVRTILKDVLEENKEIYHYGDIISMQKVFQYAFPQFVLERVKKKIPIRVICKKEEAHEELLQNTKKELREFKFIKKNLSFNSSIFIYAGKVAIFNIKNEPYHAIIIENKDFYETQKTMFEIIWEK